MKADEIRERFFRAQSRRYESVDVPLIGALRIRSLTIGEMQELRDSFTDDTGKINDRGRNAPRLLAAACVVDDNGDRVFSDDDAMSSAFSTIDGAPFARLYAACRKHTNFGSDPDWQAVEAAAKNSGATG